MLGLTRLCVSGGQPALHWKLERKGGTTTWLLVGKDHRRALCSLLLGEAEREGQALGGVGPPVQSHAGSFLDTRACGCSGSTGVLSDTRRWCGDGAVPGLCSLGTTEGAVHVGDRLCSSNTEAEALAVGLGIREDSGSATELSSRWATAASSTPPRSTARASR